MIDVARSHLTNSAGQLRNVIFVNRSRTKLGSEKKLNRRSLPPDDENRMFLHHEFYRAKTRRFPPV